MIIRTKYLGPTYTLGSRIAATTNAIRKVVSYDPSLCSYENHIKAARSLGYKGTFQQESWERGWLFVSVNPRTQVEL
jgi:hypothetical protein